MTNFVFVTVSAVFLLVISIISAPLAEGGVVHELDIRLHSEKGLVMELDSEPVDMAELEEGTEVKICNELDVGVVSLIIRVNGEVVFNPNLGPQQCAQDFLEGNDLHVGDPELPSGVMYKVSEGSILIDGCSVILGQSAIFSLGTCQGDEQRIGGEIIPIKTTSLLLASTQSTTWIIPIVLSIVGMGLLFSSRKSENS